MNAKKNVSVTDIFLQTQFSHGIKDSWIKEQILQSELVNFSDIVNKAIALEASKIESPELSKSPNTNKSSPKYINKLSKTNRHLSNVKTLFKTQNAHQKQTI